MPTPDALFSILLTANGISDWKVRRNGKGLAKYTPFALSGNRGTLPISHHSTAIWRRYLNTPNRFEGDGRRLCIALLRVGHPLRSELRSTAAFSNMQNDVIFSRSSRPEATPPWPCPGDTERHV